MNSDNQNSNLEVFPWNKNFETGHEEIDRQHRKLVNLLNELAIALTQEETIEINEAFVELAEYADYHFSYEESVWAEYLNDDNWLTSHQLNHVSFLPKVLDIKKNEANNPLHIVIEEIVKFLIRWLAFHIIDDDKRLAVTIDAIEKGSSVEDAKRIADRAMGGSMRVLIETVMAMYDSLSSRTLSLARERNVRIQKEKELEEANKRLEELAITDQLTGLYNRRHFEHSLVNELQKSRRMAYGIDLLLIDLDYFKKLNDTFGHSSGDTALEKIGKCISSSCQRPGDLAFRLGGEEFAIISASESSSSAQHFAENIRENIFNLAIENMDSSTGNILTCSIGAVSIKPEETLNSTDYYLNLADKRMYKAKSLGRNRVVSQD